MLRFQRFFFLFYFFSVLVTLSFCLFFTIVATRLHPWWCGELSGTVAAMPLCRKMHVFHETLGLLGGLTSVLLRTVWKVFSEQTLYGRKYGVT